MMDEKLREGIISSILLSGLFSTLIFLMIEVIFAQMVLDYVLPLTQDSGMYFNVFLIFIGGEMIALTISIIIPFIMRRKLPKSLILKASLLGFLVNLVFWIILSFMLLFFLYPEIFKNIVGYEIIFITPVLVVYLGIYVFNDVTFIWFLSQITYFLFFALFLYLFGRKNRNTTRIIEVNYRW